MFSVRPDVVIPTVNRFLGSNYDSFLVTPGWLSSFFPKRFFEKNGLTEMYGFSELPETFKVLGASRHKNEIDTIGFFLDQIKSAREPFFAVYYSYAAHHPYFDYGEKYRLFTDVKNDVNRYYNNLFLLDMQIQRIFNSLELVGLMDNTIIVVVGDHGQAFGQHKGVWKHGTSSFNEEFKVPMVFYQPKLFPPKTISALTSHVDILPTILDAMSIKYNRSLFQGESILRETFNRKYIFLINHGGTISSISKEKVKLTISYSEGKCWIYDLNRDPFEREMLDCHEHEGQLMALLSFRKYQQDILARYNLSQKREESFFGEKHPGIRTIFPPS
jgi:membrane-anchored protein YejM (alkaline phosphatase superfamily)